MLGGLLVTSCRRAVVAEQRLCGGQGSLVWTCWLKIGALGVI